ncbi:MULTISPECIES: 6-pyruvoyl trahydropterin synthase family protein [Cohnella]|uniref:6-pyruvoyl trahydropterin synthase family protein n=1 Tax=Cohnella TaxID=329857 RepID=UPI0009B9A063|nr:MULTISPECIES: 6-carboxytetrahydropterin synthase [Cohnella]MBN2980365.1 6-carboxytetrahydropterin synthase [Cohnella algarum]
MLFQYYPSVAHNYKFELNKDIHLASAHFNPHESAGKSRNMHGHTFIVNITIGGNELADSGFLVNFGTINEMVYDKFDSTVLNDHPEFSETFPTTEGIAQTLFHMIDKELEALPNKPKLLQVLVRENPSSYVAYRG